MKLCPLGATFCPRPCPWAQIRAHILARRVGCPRVRGYFLPVAIFSFGRTGGSEDGGASCLPARLPSRPPPIPPVLSPSRSHRCRAGGPCPPGSSSRSLAPLAARTKTQAHSPPPPPRTATTAAAEELADGAARADVAAMGGEIVSPHHSLSLPPAISIPEFGMEHSRFSLIAPLLAGVAAGRGRSRMWLTRRR